MKYFLYIFYFFRSVFLRGFFNTIKLLQAEAVNEKKFHIKTAAIKKSDSSEYFHYQGASYRVLLNLFNDILPKTKDFTFVDIGCGKGRALFVAEYCGYNHLIGIELDDALLNEAKENLKSYAFKREDSSFSFIHQNAVDYPYKNEACVYFLFNPFNEDVLRKVLDKVCAATESETWFIYMNPLHPKPFKEKNIEVIREFKTGRYLEAIIYRIPKSKFS